MKIFKSFIHAWLTLISVLGFFTSWFFFVRATEVNKNQQEPNPDSTLSVELTPIINLDNLITFVPATQASLQKFTLVVPPTATNQPTPLPVPTNQPTPLPAPTNLPTPVPAPTYPPAALSTPVPTLAPMVIPTNSPTQPGPTPSPVVRMTPRIHTGGS